MLRIAIVEDDPSTRQILQGFVEQYAAEQGLECTVTPYEDGAQIAAGYHPATTLFLWMWKCPAWGDFPACSADRAVDSEAVLVFVTNMAQYAIRGYEVDALDYVLKPVDYYQFSTKLSRAIQRVQRQRGGQILLQCAGGGVQLVETSPHLLPGDPQPDAALPYCRRGVHGAFQPAKCGKPAGPLSLCPCNQCYLVNLKHVKAVENDFVLVGEARLEISRRQRAAFLTALASYIGGVL